MRVPGEDAKDRIDGKMEKVIDFEKVKDRAVKFPNSAESVGSTQVLE